MSTGNFTKGDWRVQTEQIWPNSAKECFTVVSDEWDVVSPLLGIRLEADATLIAAAKKLYQALGGLCQAAEYGCVEMGISKRLVKPY